MRTGYVLAVVAHWTLAIAWYALGFWAWVIYARALVDWLGGFFGFIVSVVAVPGVILFPIIHWLVEETWPATFLWVTLAAFVAYVLAAAATWVEEALE